MGRFVRLVRLVLGSLLLAWSGWTLVRAQLKRSADPRAVSFGIGAQGEVYGLRVGPLDAGETRAALERERELYTEAWREQHPDGLTFPPLPLHGVTIIPRAPDDGRPIGLES